MPVYSKKDRTERDICTKFITPVSPFCCRGFSLYALATLRTDLCGLQTNAHIAYPCAELSKGAESAKKRIYRTYPDILSGYVLPLISARHQSKQKSQISCEVDKLFF